MPSVGPDGGKSTLIGRLLHQIWRDHPRCYRLDNEGRDWAAKSREARDILSRLLHGTV